ncbi:MAG: ribosome maturation factor RimM [Actinomycetaceae bacterium]|nr:ribosome maturation factor RimM [Actinomycetaceae bacterium]
MDMTAAIIGPAHGLHGEVIVDVRTDNDALFIPGESFRTSSDNLPQLTLIHVRSHKDRILAAFEEIATREEAEAARGVALLVAEHEEEDAWYPHQLKGLRAQTPDGADLGVVSGLQSGVAQDLLLVRTSSGVVMVPFVHQIVPSVDIAAGLVVIDPPGGLFDDEVIDGPDGGGA